MANGQYANGNNEQYGVAAGGVGDGLPAGVILMWSGSVDSIPAGYAFCDGTNGTPDLRNRFVVCAQQDHAGIAKANADGSGLKQTGGATSHDHTFTTNGHAHYVGSTGTAASDSRHCNSSNRFDKVIIRRYSNTVKLGL